MSDDTLMQECIDNCRKCYEACTKAITYCLEKGGKHAEPEHIKVLMDCAEICRTNLSFMLRGSKQQASVSTACALVCRVCGTNCEAMAEDDEVMKDCAAACFRCAESCEAMSAAA